MDYSTISNKTTFTEQEDLTNGELSERYYLLKKQYENLSSSFEATRQELHDARRSYQTALDIQSHLSAELESHQADEAKRKSDLLSKISSLQDEISELRQERNTTAEQHSNELKKFEQEIKLLKEEQNNKPPRVSPERNSAELDETRANLNTALHDLHTAKLALDEAKNEIEAWRMKAEEMLMEMGEIRAASEMRKEELKAANEREAVAFGDLAEARAMLHQFQSVESQAEPHAAKGNSIFAEVEDKRQEMAKNLIQMKQTNSRLRRELASKHAEVEALLYEKQNIWEQQAGAAAHHDRELLESYEERISQLEGSCERQRRELARWCNKHCDPTANGWLSGVLEHFKSECERLRAEVLSQGAAQLASAAQIRDLRRKLAQLTATGARIPSNTPPNKTQLNDSNDKVEISIPKPAVEISLSKVMKSKTVDDVKKKVSFN